jgi:alpha-beta hydrolase superfamily lysophospholipase
MMRVPHCIDRWSLIILLLVLGWLCAGCGTVSEASQPHPPDIRFAAADGTLLAGELLMPEQSPRALVMIIHHAGPVDRTSYTYMVEQLLPAGYAVFRFDKRGTGASGGRYGCCEFSDALAAYAAAVQQPATAHLPVIIVAQSMGTRALAEQFAAFVALRPPAAVALLSNLLEPAAITTITTPIIVIVADSEPALAQIGPQAVAAHNAALPFSAELYIAAGAEHSLFDITDGPIDWEDPRWAERYHRGAMRALLDWLARQPTAAGPFWLHLPHAESGVERIDVRQTPRHAHSSEPI